MSYHFNRYIRQRIGTTRDSTDHRWLLFVNSYPDRQHPVHVDDAGQGQESDDSEPPRLAIGSGNRYHSEECGLLEVRQHDDGKGVRHVVCEGRAPLTLLDCVLTESGSIA